MTACAAPAAGGRPWKKNSRGDRRHRSGLAARCRRRSHHRYPLDPPHHREDRNRTRHPRHPGLSDRRPHPQGPRLPAARQPQARLGRLRPRRRPAVSVHRRAARPIRPTRPADRQHRYQKARTNRQPQEPRQHLGTISTSRQRPRLPRPTASPSPTASTTFANRGRGRRHLPRYSRLRCRQPGQMVAARRPRTLLRRLRAAAPTPAAATPHASVASSMLSRPASPTPPQAPSVIIPAAPPSGTPSTIACSARSARTGPATRCAATRHPQPHPYHHHRHRVVRDSSTRNTRQNIRRSVRFHRT